MPSTLPASSLTKVSRTFISIPLLRTPFPCLANSSTRSGARLTDVLSFFSPGGSDLRPAPRGLDALILVILNSNGSWPTVGNEEAIARDHQVFMRMRSPDLVIGGTPNWIGATTGLAQSSHAAWRTCMTAPSLESQFSPQDQTTVHVRLRVRGSGSSLVFLIPPWLDRRHEPHAVMRRQAYLRRRLQASGLIDWRAGRSLCARTTGHTAAVCRRTAHGLLVPSHGSEHAARCAYSTASSRSM
jgi:hypothetical protein